MSKIEQWPARLTAELVAQKLGCTVEGCMCSPGAACSDRWASRPPTEQNTTPTSTWNAWPTTNPGSPGCRTRLSNISGKRTTRAASRAAAPRPGPVRNDGGTMIRQLHPTPVMLLKGCRLPLCKISAIRIMSRRLKRVSSEWFHLRSGTLMAADVSPASCGSSARRDSRRIRVYHGCKQIRRPVRATLFGALVRYKWNKNHARELLAA